MKVAVENTSASPMYVAGVMIPAGETRHFDQGELPPELHPQAATAPAEATPADLLAELLKFSVAEIVARIDAFDDAVLAELIEREEAAAKPRKSLLSALVEAQLQRAANRAEPGQAGTAPGASQGEDQ